MYKFIPVIFTEDIDVQYLKQLSPNVNVIFVVSISNFCIEVQLSKHPLPKLCVFDVISKTTKLSPFAKENWPKLTEPAIMCSSFKLPHS